MRCMLAMEHWHLKDTVINFPHLPGDAVLGAGTADTVRDTEPGFLLQSTSKGFSLRILVPGVLRLSWL